MDVDLIREETPSCKKIIHFNNAGSSLMPDSVFKVILDYMKLENEIGGYELMEKEAKGISRIYQQVSNLIHCKEEEIALFENATRAWQSFVYGLELKKDDVILTTTSEYISNYLSLLHLKKEKGIQLITLEEDDFGQTCIDDFKKKCKEYKNKIKLLSLCHIPTSSGLINPEKDFGEICNEEGIFYFLDTTQSVGHLHLDVENIGCDALVGTGRKYLRGPRGTGFLYVRKNKQSEVHHSILDNLSATLIDPNRYEVNSSLKGLETWEKNYALILGIGKASEYATQLGTQNIENRCLELGNYFRERLQSLHKVTVQDPGKRKSALVTFSVEGMKSEVLSSQLKERKINTNWVPATRALLDFPKRKISDVVRASLHYFNTYQEIDQFIDELKGLIKG